MAGSRVGLFDNLNIPIHRDAQHREDKECRARGGKRGLVAVARRRLPALLRLGWGLGGRRRGRALVARTDFSPLDIAS